MGTLSLEVVDADGGRESRQVRVERIANCGYTGRNEAEVRRHIAELEAEGVPAPETFPTVYPKPSHLLTTGPEIEVPSSRTSGEVEFALFPTGSETYVGVGSDHTDRQLEEEDVLLSKTVCENVVSDVAWRLSDVVDHWDRLVMRSWTGREREPYQEATLDAVLPPDELLSLVEGRSTEPLDGTAVFSGSVGTTAGELVYADRFAAELYDPVLDRSLSAEYDVRELDWLA